MNAPGLVQTAGHPAKLFIAILMALCFWHHPLGAREGSPQEFKKFGFYSLYTEEARSYPRTNQSDLAAAVKHYGFMGTWDLNPSLERESYVELGWRRERFESAGTFMFENDLYGMGLGNRRPFSLSPYLSLVAQGGLLAQFETTSPMSSNTFSSMMGPALGAVNLSNQAATATTNVSLTGGRFTLDLNLLFKWVPVSFFESRTAIGGYAGAELLTVPAGSDAIPLFILRWGLEARQRFTFPVKQVEPWIEYRLTFLAGEKNAIGPYTLALPLRHTVFLGITFRFSLLIFG